MLEDRVVGVPEISPEFMSMTNPEGRAGLIEYPYTFDEESRTTYLRSVLVES